MGLSRVILAHESKLLRGMLFHVLGRYAELVIVGQTNDVGDLPKLIEAVSPQWVVLSKSSPTAGTSLQDSLLARYSDVKLLTMYDDNLELTHEVDAEVREFFGDIVFSTVIPRDPAVSEAPSHGMSVLDYAPRARGTRAYIELCMEVLDRE